MKESEGIISKMLMLVANIACESASVMCFYEPKVPEKMSEIKKSKK